MRSLLITALALQVLPGLAAGVPDMECREGRVLFIEPKALSTQQFEGTTVYRIKAGSLYLTPSDRPEYLYGKLSEAEPSRFVVGHKTFLFEPRSDFRTASVVHANRDEMRISQVSCSRR